MPWIGAVLALLSAREAGRALLLERLDRGIAVDARSLLEAWRKDPGSARWKGGDPLAEVASDHRLQTYFEIRRPDGRILSKSPLLAGADLPRALGGEGEGWYHDLYRHRMRWVSIVGPDSAAPVELVCARDYRGWKEQCADLDLWGALGLLAAGATALVAWRLARRRSVRVSRANWSLRNRIVAGSALVAGVVLGAASWVTYGIVERGWVGQMDQALESRARGTAALCRREDGIWHFDGAHLDSTSFRDPKSLQYFQVRDTSGAEVGRSASLGHLEFAPEEADAAPRFGWFHPTFLHRTRYVLLRVSLPGGAVDVWFGQDYRAMKARLRELQWILAGVWAGSSAAIALLLFFVVGLLLRPLRRMAQRLEEVDENHLGKVAGTDGAPREIRVLVDALDSALARLDTAFERERTLVADLAHEIRTPLAGLRAILEVDRTDSVSRPAESLERCLEIVLQMQSLVDSLLALARVEGGQTRAEPVSVGLRGIVDDAVFRSVPEGPEVRLSVGEELSVVADAQWLSVVLRNLLENAVEHAGPGGWIEIAAGTVGGSVRLRVRNPGCRIAPADASKVFDRFWSGDRSRSRIPVHAGLGLALCRGLVHRMGGAVRAAVEDQGVFRAEVDLPAGDDSSSLQLPPTPAQQARNGSNNPPFDVFSPA